MAYRDEYGLTTQDYVKPVILGFVDFIFGILAVFIVPFLLPFIKWTEGEQPEQWGAHPTIRGKLPKWLSWFETPDMPLPGGLYEDTVNKVFLKYGKVICAWYWIGLRNRVHGFAKFLGRPSNMESHRVTLPQLDPSVFVVRPDKSWIYVRRWKKIGFSFTTGYRVYATDNGHSTGKETYYASPAFTIKRWTPDD